MSSHQYGLLKQERKGLMLETSRKITNDCGVIAAAVVTGCSYREAYLACKAEGRPDGKGMYTPDLIRAINRLGFRCIVTALENKARTVASMEKYLYKHRRGEKFLITVRRHFCAFNGVKIADWTAGRRHRIEWVYCVVPK